MFSIKSIRRMIPSTFVAACVAGATLFGGASQADAQSSYLTIQPNATNDAFVYTFSWVARDTDNDAGGTAFSDTGSDNPYCNGGAALDNVDNLFGGNYTFDNTANGGSATTKILYVSGMKGSNGFESDNVPVNTTTWVNYQDPLNVTVGGAGLPAASPKFDSSGNWTTRGSIIVASGVQGVTGVFSTDPNGTGASTGSGVGFWMDTDGADDATGTDDFGPLLVGYDYVLDPTQSNVMPNTGYVKVVVPYPTTGFVGDPFTTCFHPGVYTNNAAVEITVTTDNTYTPELAVSGDFNGDHIVNNSDVLTVVSGFTGSAGTGQWYADGDLDADGNVDNGDVIGVISAFTGSSAGNVIDTGAIDLIYDPSTGNVTLDTLGGTLAGFQLENLAGGSDFTPGNFIPPFGTLPDATATVLGDSNPFGAITGVFDIGNVFPTGLDLSGLEAFLSTADYTAGLGQPITEFDLVVAAIPTPAALPAGLALLGLVISRRRRS